MTRFAHLGWRSTATAALLALGLGLGAGPADADPEDDRRSYGPHVVSHADCGLSDTLGLEPGTFNLGSACFAAKGSRVSVVVNDASGLNTASKVQMRNAAGTTIATTPFCTRIDNMPIPAGTAFVVVVNENPGGQALSTAGVCSGRIAASTAGEITAIFS